MEIVAGVFVALIAVFLIGYPLFIDRPQTQAFGSDGEIRQEVDRFRAALKSKTLCDHCLSPNPAKSNYCAECGRGL